MDVCDGEMPGGSLREAILDANANPGSHEIHITVSSTITLQCCLPTIESDVIIYGLGAEAYDTSIQVPTPPTGVCNGLDFDSGGSQTAIVKRVRIAGGPSTRGVRVGSAAKVTLAEMVLDRHQATEGAGVINLGKLELRNSVLKHNQASWGAGVYQDFDGASTLTVRHVILRNNQATFGTGIAVRGGSAVVEHVTVKDNTTGSGALYVQNGTVFLANSTFHGNVGAVGALFCKSGSLTLDHVTLAENRGVDAAGIWRGGAGAIKARHLVLANAPDIECDGTAGQPGDAVLDSDATCAFTGSANQPGVAALLLPLADNGCIETTPDGCTQTHGLAPASPARDTGVSPFCLSLDQRMSPRPAGTGCDLGAFEAQ